MRRKIFLWEYQRLNPYLSRSRATRGYIEGGIIITMDFHFKEIDFKDIVFKDSNESIIETCTTPYSGNPDGCPNFGKTWGCPPHAPKLEEFKEKIRNYSHFYLVYLERKLEPGYQDNKRVFNQVMMEYGFMNVMLNDFMDHLAKENKEILHVHGEGCKYCTKHGIGSCTCPDAECRYPDKKSYSLSVALDIIKTMNGVGIGVELDPSKVLMRIGFVVSKASLDFEQELKKFKSDTE
ncbi:MAG: DUF2284 domain-containing protein [Candidatus Hodarchaeota archaeon]